MILPLAFYGDSILRQKSVKIVEINDEIRQLVKDMEETLDFHKGVGLAAPQVHRGLALFVTKLEHQDANGEWMVDPLRVFINPRIVAYSEELSTYQEGCLSIPGVYVEVKRPKSVTLEAMDLEGNIFEEEFHYLDAHCIMHENDHLNGTLHIDRYRGRQRAKLEEKLQQIKKKHQK